MHAHQKRLWSAEYNLFGVLSLAVVSACGFSQNGEGSRTLEVIASSVYYANDANTLMRAEVRDKSQSVVQTATVSLQDADTRAVFAMTFDGVVAYTVTVPGYHRRLILQVKRDQDWLTATIEGPAGHSVLRPTAGNARSIKQPLDVQWAAEDGVRAEQVVIDLSQADFVTVLTNDPGGYVIPQNALRLGNGPLAVRRQNSVVLAGGIGAASLTAGFEVRVDVTIAE